MHTMNWFLPAVLVLALTIGSGPGCGGSDKEPEDAAVDLALDVLTDSRQSPEDVAAEVLDGGIAQDIPREADLPPEVDLHDLLTDSFVEELKELPEAGETLDLGPELPMEITQDIVTEVAPEVVVVECPDGLFGCQDGECIEAALTCDGWKDCGDGSDEAPALCAGQGCVDGAWQCEDGECIPELYLCDDFDDCLGAEDEAEEMCGATTCPEGMWLCPIMESCISATLVCDGNYDCAMGEDEEEDLCAGLECPQGTWTCDDGSCIDMTWVCDGNDDCGGSEDEEAIMCEAMPCPPAKWQCPTGACLFADMVCDGWPDCADGPDETAALCGVEGCKAGAWPCTDGSCILEVWRCNGENECAGGEDEEADMCAEITCDDAFVPTCVDGLYTDCILGFKKEVLCLDYCISLGFAGFDSCIPDEVLGHDVCLCL